MILVVYRLLLRWNDGDTTLAWLGKGSKESKEKDRERRSLEVGEKEEGWRSSVVIPGQVQASSGIAKGSGRGTTVKS